MIMSFMNVNICMKLNTKYLHSCRSEFYKKIFRLTVGKLNKILLTDETIVLAN